jgi:hypothetical protein
MLDKKKNFIQKIKLRQNGGKLAYTMLIKVALKLNFTFISNVKNANCH